MEQKTEFVLDMLNGESVSVLQKKYFEFDGKRYYIGNIRNAYLNDEQGRTALEELLPTEYYNAIIAVWGVVQMEVYRRLTLDCNVNNYRRENLTGYEHGVTVFEIVLINKKQRIDVPETASAFYHGTKADGHILNIECKIKDNKIYLPVILQMTTCFGSLDGQLEIQSDTGNIRFSGLNFKVFPSPETAQIESKDEFTFYEKIIEVLDNTKKSKFNCYRTIADMVADKRLEIGMTAKTLGYFNPNDLGASEYVIQPQGDIRLNNGLHAQIVVKPQMNVECFGAIGDKEDFDNSEVIEKASKHKTQLMFSNKTYHVCRTLNIQNGINWKGNETVFKLDDDFEVDQSLTACIYVLGESIIEGIAFEYNSKYWINDFETTKRVYDEDGNKIEYPHLTVLKIKAGENHFLKNVKLNITENKATDILPYGAEVAGIWYFFTDYRKHNLVVENCNINNLSFNKECCI